MAFAEVIVNLFVVHFYTASFVSGLFGEEAVLFLTFLASHSLMHIKIMFLLAPLGILIMDTIYFSIGRTHLLHWLKRRFKKLKISPTLVSLDKRYHLPTLILTKFIFSTRIAFMVYLGAHRMKYLRFIAYDLVAVYIWAGVMIPLAWFAGRGITTGLYLVKDFSKFIGLALVFLVIVYVINKILQYYFVNGKKPQRKK
jgi:membrane protein DedA with SNARE-associated domain